MKIFSRLRGLPVRFAAAFLCLATLTNCSHGSIPSNPTATAGVSCFSNIPHADTLPLGAHVDCHGAPSDAFGRPLSYVGRNVPWRAIDRGVGIDPSLPAAPPGAIAKAQHDAALPHAGSTTPSFRTASDCTFGLASRSRASLTWVCDDGALGAAALTSIEGIPHGKLTVAPDSYYYDEKGDQWWYDVAGGRWLKTIAIVKSTPSQSEYYPYYVAYDFINGMAPIWWAVSLPVPEGLAPFGTIAERFGMGAYAVSERALAGAMEDVASAVGADNVLRMQGFEADNVVAQSGQYTTPPWMFNYEVAQFTVNDSMLTGKIAGKQLIRIAVDEDRLRNRSPWLTTLDQITKQDGTLMSAAEIADKFALPTVPKIYAEVDNLTSDTKFLVGLAGAVQKWGNGGGVQYYRLTGTYRLGIKVSIP